MIFYVTIHDLADLYMQHIYWIYVGMLSKRKTPDRVVSLPFI